MKISVKFKPRWPLSLFLKQRESTYELLPEPTPDEIALARELKKAAAGVDVDLDPPDPARSIRGYL